MGRLKIQSYEQKKTGGGKRVPENGQNEQMSSGSFSSANLERSSLWLDVCVHMCEEWEVGMVGEQEVGE